MPLYTNIFKIKIEGSFIHHNNILVFLGSVNCGSPWHNLNNIARANWWHGDVRQNGISNVNGQVVLHGVVITGVASWSGWAGLWSTPSDGRWGTRLATIGSSGRNTATCNISSLYHSDKRWTVWRYIFSSEGEPLRDRFPLKPKAKLAKTSLGLSSSVMILDQNIHSFYIIVTTILQKKKETGISLLWNLFQDTCLLK